MVPGLPNFFMLYGPNTNPMGGLGVVNHEEMMTRYALELIQHLILEGHNSVDVTEEAYWRYNEALDELARKQIWGEPTVRNYYFNGEYGRSAVNCPFPGNQMWRWLREPDFSALIVR
jgi:4-hydroxyacetophenone monooxygenase